MSELLPAPGAEAPTPRKDSRYFQRYNLNWPHSKDPMSLELDMIRHGGQWKKKNGEMAGNGLAFHYRRFQELAWPTKMWQKGPFKNHWAEKCLEVYLNYVYIGAMGCAGSGKSDSFGGNVLTDWYAHSDCTTVLVSSTDRQSLELRIWGMIKKYHRMAKTGRSWLPGYLIEGKQMLTLHPRQDAEEGRDFKNGIIGVACKKGSQFVGLGPLIGIHNKRVRLLADECFLAGTMVDFPGGQMPIEKVKVGDVVQSAPGIGRVIRVIKNTATKLVRVRTKDGKSAVCTPDHPFLTQNGWIKAVDLNQTHYIPCSYETMRILQIPHAGKKPPFLLSVLQREMDAQPAGNTERARPEDFSGFRIVKCGSPGMGEVSFGAIEEPNPSADNCSGKEMLQDTETYWPPSVVERWQRHRANQGRAGHCIDISGDEVEFCHQDRHESGQRVSPTLQSGHRLSGNKTGYRGRRGFARPTFKTGTGHEKNKYAYGDWVDRVEILKQADIERLSKCGGGVEVYNLEIEGHPSYSVAGGLVVHNCNLMPRAFLDAAANLSKCENFKLVGLGNPNETTNAHGFLCEPSVELGGWEGGVDQTAGTKTWPTRLPNGICLQLPGSDSPNIPAERQGHEPPFPFLITDKQMKEDAQIWGVDDWHYTMMNEAKMPRGQGSRRVLTRQACVKFGAFGEPNWRDSRRTRIAFLDAAYRGVGGDRCVFGELQFGYEVEPLLPDALVPNLVTQVAGNSKGRQIIALIDMMMVPISSEVGAEPAEDQISKFIQAQCNARGIPPENFFYDAGMRTTLVMALSRTGWQNAQSIDCGGKPSDRMVSSDIHVPCEKYYSKFITELWYSVRYAVESGQFRSMTEEVVTEFNQREWKMVSGNRIEVESKEDMKVKTGRSPDLADALAVGLHGAKLRGFNISKLSSLAPPKPNGGKDWRDEFIKKAKAIARHGQLNHAA